MSIVDRISELAKANGLTIAALEREAKLGNGTIGKWKRQNPSCENLRSVADCLNTSTDYLISGKPYKMELSDDIKKLIKNYSIVDENGKGIIQKQAQLLADLTIEVRKLKAHEDFHIKLFDAPVSAGEGIYIDYTSAEEVVIHESTDEADYAVRISGDSMEPCYFDGDIVLVEATPMVEIGEIGIFILNGMAYIKKKGNGALISLNNKYDPIPVSEADSFYCQGRVIKSIKI